MKNSEFLKSFALDHPILSFLIIDCVVSTIAKLCAMIIMTVGAIFGVNYKDESE